MTEIPSHKTSGDVPLTVCWELGLTAMQIENGAADSYLKSWAKEMAAYGHPIIFAPLDEMNGNWNAYSGDPNALKRHGFAYTGSLRGGP